MQEKYSRNEIHIIASPVDICGEYGSEGFSLKRMLKQKNFEGIQFYVINSTNKGDNDTSIGLESTTSLADTKKIDLFAKVASLAFGKHIYYCGILDSDWSYYLPDLEEKIISYKRLPICSSKERVDESCKLNWHLSTETILQIVEKVVGNDLINDVLGYYCRALRTINFDIEVSYIDFVRCMEILSRCVVLGNTPDPVSILGDDEKRTYEIIHASDQRLSKLYLNRSKLKKSFCDAIIQLLPLNDPFRKSTESNQEAHSFIQLEKAGMVIEAIKNIYDIRSGYVHEGLNFSSYVLPNRSFLNEVSYSQPDQSGGVITAGETISILGVERIVRKCILNYIQSL